METKNKKITKNKGRKTAVFTGTVCSAVMLLSGGVLLGGCGDDTQTAKRGLSAYEIAVNYGYEGTEAQWIYDLQHQSVQGEQGPRGDDGRSAYDVAVDEGFVGTPAEWLASLASGGGSAGANGKSAYEIAVENGYQGNEEAWLASLVGSSGPSAYQIAVANGFVGDEAAWLASLKGKSAYELAYALDNTIGTEQEWLASLKGQNGKSAYEIAVDNGFQGDETAWLESLKAPTITSLRYVEDNTGAYIVTTFSDGTSQNIYLNRAVTTKEALVEALTDPTITAITIGDDITIDEDVSWEDKSITVATGGSLTLGGDSQNSTTVSLNNTSIEMNGGTLVIANANVTVDQGSSVEINGGSLAIGENTSLVVDENSSLTINNTTITSDIDVQADDSANVELNNCTINGTFTVNGSTLSNPGSGSAKLNNGMLLGNEQEQQNAQQTVTPGVVLNNVHFNGNVVIDADLDVILTNCTWDDTTKTATASKGNIVLEGNSFALLPYLTLSGTATADVYAQNTNALTAANSFNASSEIKAGIYLAADIVETDPFAINSSMTINGQNHKLKANISGNGTIVFNDIWTTNITVAANGFSGTLIFNGGKLDTDRPGTSDSAAAFYSTRNGNATFEFHDMAITANITKGIKIYNAKAVVIDNCEFDATKLHVMENELNSDIQSLSLVDIQIGTGTMPTDITINGCQFIGAPQGSTAVPTFIDASGTLADSDTGAAIKIKAENGVEFGTVAITNNTFAGNYRDILLGTGPYANQLQMGATEASNGRSGDGLANNVTTNWTISGNTTDITQQVVDSRGVATLSYIGGQAPFNKYTTRVGNVGELVGGCGIWVISNAFEKINGIWYYKENGEYYSVSVNAGQAVFANVWDGIAGEMPTEVNNTYSIDNAQQFAAFAQAVNNGNTFEGKTILLNADIDLNNIEFTPIGYGTCDHPDFSSNQTGAYFSGTFNGQNHTIHNLKITTFSKGGEGDADKASAGTGLFGQVNDGTIQNVQIDGAIVSGNHYVGALAGFVLFSTIDNCSVTNAAISCVWANDDDSGDKAGALIGYAAGTVRAAAITNCSATNSTVNADRDAGQVVGCAHRVQTTTNNTATNVTVTGNSTNPDTGKSGQNINNDIIGRVVA